MRYLPTVHVNDPDRLAAIGLQRGQWLNYGGAQGRWAGVRNGTIWIMWSGTAGRKRSAFTTFTEAFKRGRH